MVIDHHWGMILTRIVKNLLRIRRLTYRHLLNRSIHPNRPALKDPSMFRPTSCNRFLHDEQEWIPESQHLAVNSLWIMVDGDLIGTRSSVVYRHLVASLQRSSKWVRQEKGCVFSLLDKCEMLWFTLSLSAREFASINHGIGDGGHLYPVTREHISLSPRIRGHLAQPFARHGQGSSIIWTGVEPHNQFGFQPVVLRKQAFTEFLWIG